jgi:hypothetical protein
MRAVPLAFQLFQAKSKGQRGGGDLLWQQQPSRCDSACAGSWKDLLGPPRPGGQQSCSAGTPSRRPPPPVQHLLPCLQISPESSLGRRWVSVTIMPLVLLYERLSLPVKQTIKFGLENTTRLYMDHHPPFSPIECCTD